MRIGFIGAGKVGFTFGRYIAEKRELVREKTDGALCLEVGGYFSASRQSAELAAEFTETCVYDSLEQLWYNRGWSLWLFDSSYVCNKFKVRIL